MGVFMQVQGKRNRRVVVLLEGVMAVAAEVHPDLIEVISHNHWKGVVLMPEKCRFTFREYPA